MIADLISELFERIGHTWSIGGRILPPTPDDVSKVLDNAAATLYDGEPEDQYERGGIIVQKNGTGYDTYVYIGTYY